MKKIRRLKKGFKDCSKTTEQTHWKAKDRIFRQTQFVTGAVWEQK
jgi:hypothetical protein